jgi:hypothetical protein
MDPGYTARVRDCSESTDDLLRKLICRLLCPPAHRVVEMVRRYAFPNFSFTCEGAQMALTVKDTEVPGSVVLTVSFVDSKGKPAKVDGVPILSVDNTDVVDQAPAFTDNGDGSFSSTLHITDNTGAAQLTVVADADLGGGTTSITSVDTVSVIPGDAVAANFAFGAVTPDTPPGP